MMINRIEKTPFQISRRTFLKTLGAGLAAASGLSAGWLLALPGPAQIDLGNRLLRGTPAGLISQSLDNGQTWQPLANFGAHCRVDSLRTLNGMIYARMMVAGHAFWLSSSDAKTWRTVS
jgi:hypothetical protein